MTAPVGRLAGYQRRTFAIWGFLLLGLLALARFLSPDAAGFGTHRQLGLPACTFQTIFGFRCPTCGMTTSWSHLMRGNLSASWQANAGGTCLAVLTLCGAAWALLVAFRGTVQPQIPRRMPTLTTIAIVAIIAIDWGMKLL